MANKKIKGICVSLCWGRRNIYIRSMIGYKVFRIVKGCYHTAVPVEDSELVMGVKYSFMATDKSLARWGDSENTGFTFFRTKSLAAEHIEALNKWPVFDGDYKIVEITAHHVHVIGRILWNDLGSRLPVLICKEITLNREAI